MPGYPTAGTETRVPFEVLLDRVGLIFRSQGMSDEDAHLVAHSLVIADARGVHSHGVLRVPEYVKKLSTGGVDPRGKPRVASDSAAAMVVDGGNAMGQIACAFAMERAIERARQTNVAAVAVRGSNHCGALFYYAMMGLSENMIGIVTTNALPTMAPWGGTDKIVGINPLAVAFPSGEEPPIVLDAAFSGSSHGKIRVYHQKGLSIPEGWAFDANGNPTTDSGAALNGLLQPIGGYKGVALAIVSGILSSLLSGAAYGTELGDMTGGPKAGLDGQFLIAIRIDAFEAAAKFRARVDGIIREIRHSRPAPGVERLYAPGELEHETELAYRRTGIPLNDETLSGLEACERACPG